MAATDRRHEDEAADEAHPHHYADQEAEATAPDGLSDRQAAVLGLSQTIGNQAVGALLRKSGGAALPKDTRAGMEARLGHAVKDDVRVHTGAAAERSAQGLGARAYTVGSDVVFGAGEFAPGTDHGDDLLAHELAHVVQHDETGQPANPGRLNPRGHASEQQAQAASQGQPTALNAAPAGIARAVGDNEPAAPVVDEAQVPAAVPGSPTVTAAKPEITVEDIERDKAIDDAIEIADTRGRTLLNTDYNDVQDASRDFESTTADGIDSLDAVPSGYLGLASTIVGFVASAVSTRYNKRALTAGTTVFSTMFTMGQTQLTADATKANDTDPKAAAKAVMRAAAKAINTAQAAFFSSMREDLHSALVKRAQWYPEVADLLADGSLESIDQVLNQHVGVPNPDTNSLYGPVRESMEIAFEDWKTKQVRHEQYHWITEDMGLSAWTAEPGRAAARNRVAQAVKARSGKPEEPDKPWAETVNESINTGLTTAFSVAFTGQLPQDPADQPPPVADVTDTLEPVDDATEAAEQGREADIQRGVTLAETRAREHLNTHYNDVQDAVRDFLSSGEAKIATLNGAVSGHWGMVSALFSGVMTYLSTKFPPTAVGKLIGLAALSAAGSGLSTVVTTAVNDDRSEEADAATKALHALATGTANTQAGIFRQAREGLADALLTVSTGKGEKADLARILLESGDRDSINAVVEENLGLPDPDLDPMYSDVRMKLEMPFADWIIRQIQAAEGWNHMAQFRTNTLPTTFEVAADTNLRDTDAPEAPLGPDTYAFMDEEQVGPTPAGAAPPGPKTEAEETAAEDRLVLKRITDVDTRARGYLNTLGDEAQDAVRDFVTRALGQTSALDKDIGDVLGFYNNLLGMGLGLVGIIATGPVGVGLVVAGIAASLGAQLAAGYQTDHNASVQENARGMINGTAKGLQSGYVAVFRAARRALGPALISAALLDEEAREALLIGGPDNYDYIISDKLGIANPQNLGLYLKARTALEDEFTSWMTKQLERDQAAHEKALQAGQAAAAEDDANRRGDTTGAAAAKDAAKAAEAKKK